jgi:outer membrane autotransporter protein
MFGVSAGWTFEPLEGLTLAPTLSLRHSELNLDAYGESGLEGFALQVESRSLVSTTVETAVELSYQPVVGGRLSPFAAYGRVGLAYELGDAVDTVSARFIAAPDIGFDISRSMDRQWITVASGFSYRFGDNASLHLEGVSDVGRDAMANTSVQAGINIRF